MKKVGLSACPINAPEYIKKLVDWIIPTKGGDGAFRHFVEKYLLDEELLDKAIEKYLKTKEFKQWNF